MNLFGLKKKSKQININDTINNLNSTIEQIEKKGNYLQKEIIELDKNAKKYIKQNNKKQALYQLKKKKLLEKEIDNLFNKKLILFKQKSLIDSTFFNNSIIKTLKKTNELNKKYINEKNIDEFENTMEEIEEQKQLVDEVNNIFEQYNEDDTDEDLLKELENIEDELIKENIKFPELPKKEMNIIKENELKELEELMM